MARGGGFSVRVDLNNTDTRLAQMDIEDLKTPMRNSGTYMETSMVKRFRTQGEGRWRPLSPATIKRHPHRAGGKPLLDTGALRNSVSGGANKNVSNKRLVYGTNYRTAPYHNFGANTGRGVIPAREFMYFSPEDEQKVKRIFSDYIDRLVR
jgi:phage gpG-like protein